MPTQPPIAYEALMALVTALYRKGVIGAADIDMMCAGLSAEAAHEVRCCAVEAEAPDQSAWRAEMARRRFTVIPNDGKAE